MVVAACPPPRSTTCNTGADCPRGDVCVLGTCHLPDEHGDPGPTDDGGTPRADGGTDAGRDVDGGGDVGDANDAGDVGDANEGRDANDVDDAGDAGDAGEAGADGGPAPPCEGVPPAFAPCSSSHPGIAACWDFDSASTRMGEVTAPDAVGGHSATGSGELVPGLRGNGYDTAGNGFLSLTAPAELVSQGPMTVDVWVFARSLPAAGSGVRQAIYDSQPQLALFLQDGGLSCGSTPQGSQAIRTLSIGFPLDAWTHVACTLASDGEGLILYMNGAEVARASHGGTLRQSDGEIFIAANALIGNEQLDGALDELRVFRTRRSANDVCWSAQP